MREWPCKTMQTRDDADWGTGEAWEAFTLRPIIPHVAKTQRKKRRMRHRSFWYGMLSCACRRFGNWISLDGHLRGLMDG